MARTVPSLDLGLSIRSEDLDDLEALFQKNWNLSGSMRLLAELQRIPGMISGPEDHDAAVARAGVALEFMPDLMQVLAEVVDARTEEGLRALALLREYAAPRFRLKPDADPGSVPAAYLKGQGAVQEILLDQTALREAWAHGVLPSCFERADGVGSQEG